MKKKFRVLATDYENFSIEYMCGTSLMGNPEGKRRQNSRILRILRPDYDYVIVSAPFQKPFGS